MPNLYSAIEDGHYAKKQLFSRDRLVAWSHSRRFETAVSLASEFAGKRVLDYGCGDGTFLALAMTRYEAPMLGVGAELPGSYLDDCRSRYGFERRLRFVDVGDLDGREQTGVYDAVFCMEVLEHVVDWEPLMQRFKRLLAPGGKLIISVPVETGLPLVFKQVVRRVAGWRKIGHYPGTSAYSAGEMAVSIFAGSAQHLPRPVFDTGGGPSYDHKGFNWKVLRHRLERDFVIERTLASPFQWLGPALATQVWFVLRRDAKS